MGKKSIRYSALMLSSVVASYMATASFASDTDMTAKPIPVTDKARLQAKTICSCVFVQGRPVGNCADGKENIYQYLFKDAQRLPSSPDQSLDISVQRDRSIVQIKDKGTTIAQSAFLPDGGGCVTVPPGAPVPAVSARPEPPHADPLPRGSLPAGVDAASLEKKLDNVFTPEGPIRGYSRAIMIVHDGKVVVERYAPGFGPQNLYYSGSISKILNNLFAGLLVADGKLNVKEKMTPPEWASISDDRKKITFDDMLFFNSGLAWDEEFFTAGAPGYNVYFAGPESSDIAKYVAQQKLEAKPGTHHEYSTGASTLLARELQARLGADRRADRAATLAYLRTKLFEPIGANHIVPEFDAAGSLMAGNGNYGVIEDWARLGELYRNDGKWGTKLILPEGWVRYSTELRPVTDPAYPYGAHLMLKHVAPGCFGHTGVGGSKMIICPDRKLTMMWLSSDFDLLGYDDYAKLSKVYDDFTALQKGVVESFPRSN